jgi:UDP-GlcNAc:undecaprenyl-phosphate GlcNAc-1-phosphate transferase
MSLYFIILLLTSLILTFSIIFYSIPIAKFLKIIDQPKENSFHKFPTPSTGGLAAFSTILIYYFYLNNISLNLIEIIILFLIFLTGFFDDKYKLSPYIRLFITVIMCFTLFKFNESFLITELNFYNFYNQKILLKQFSVIFTIFCFVILCNAYNFTDGINGLAIIIAIVWIIFLPTENFYGTIILLTNLFLLLVYNIKGKFFLGNSGSLLISFFLASQYINSYNSSFALKADQIFIIFMIPGFDFIRLFFSRIIKKKSPLLGDLNHFHHILINKYKLKKSLIIYTMMMVIPILIFNFLKIKFIYLVIFSVIVYTLILNFLKKS